MKTAGLRVPLIVLMMSEEKGKKKGGGDFNNRENGKKKKAVYSHASGCLAPSDNGVPLGFLNNNNKQKQLVSPPPSYMSTLHLAWLIAAIGGSSSSTALEL